MERPKRMNETAAERLYNLLPAIYRIRDIKQGEQMRAFMAGLESEFLRLEADIDALYDNWFIETCDQWAIPYIAELVGITGISEQEKVFATQRREVANAIAYRRRKGLIATLEHILQDVTGWPVHAVEYEQRLARTQHLAHLRLNQGRVADLHQTTALASLSGPFDAIAHTIDVRNIDAGRETRDVDTIPGKYLPPNIGLFFWRLRDYLLANVPAAAIAKSAVGRFLPAGCFTFDPLGRDMPLFNLPQEITTLRQRVDIVNVPAPIDPAHFAADLEAYRTRYADSSATDVPGALMDLNRPRNSAYYGSDRSLCIMLNGQIIPPGAVFAADLRQWRAPHLGISLAGKQFVAVDVMLGRLLFFGEKRLTRSDVVETSYCYGFSDDLGGGPYRRRLYAASTAQPPRYIHVLQKSNISTIQQALDEWAKTAQSQPPSRCVIQIHDNGVYREDDLLIDLPKQSLLVIEAVNGVRPCIVANLTAQSEFASAKLLLNGLLINGQLTMNGNGNVEVMHCTLMPSGIAVQQSGSRETPLHLAIDHSIVGPLQVSGEQVEMEIRDSIVDNASGYAIDAVSDPGADGPTLTIERVTIFGEVQAQRLSFAQDSIFTRRVFVARNDDGVISFCTLPFHSQTPYLDHCHRCPSLQVRDGILGEPLLSGDEEEGEHPAYPLFASTHYGDPGYAQLRVDCTRAILSGAADGSEMGAFHRLYQVQRQDNLRQTLAEYLPFGLATGITYRT
jgi:hypothetical protein